MSEFRVVPESPMSVTGFSFTVSIIVSNGKREIAVPISATVGFDENGKQVVMLAQDRIKFLRSLPNGEAIVRFVRGIGRASHNVATSVCHERWRATNKPDED